MDALASGAVPVHSVVAAPPTLPAAPKTPLMLAKDTVKSLEAACGMERKKAEGQLVFKRVGGLDVGRALHLLVQLPRTFLSTRELYNGCGIRLLLVELSKERFFNDDIRIGARTALSFLQQKYPLTTPRSASSSSSSAATATASKESAASGAAVGATSTASDTRGASSSSSSSSCSGLASLAMKKAPPLIKPLIPAAAPSVSVPATTTAATATAPAPSGTGSRNGTPRSASIGANVPVPEVTWPQDDWDEKSLPEDISCSNIRAGNARWLYCYALKNMAAAVRLERAIWDAHAAQNVAAKKGHGFSSHVNALNPVSRMNCNFNECYTEYTRRCILLGSDLGVPKEGLHSLIPRIVDPAHAHPLDVAVLARHNPRKLRALLL